MLFYGEYRLLRTFFCTSTWFSSTCLIEESWSLQLCSNDYIVPQYGLGWTHLLKLVALPVAYGLFSKRVEIDYMFLSALLSFT